MSQAETTHAETDQLAATARAVFADHPGEVTEGWPEQLWSTLTDLGLIHLTLPEEAGGSGGTWSDAAALLLTAGEEAAPVPLAETELAGWLLHTAGLAVPTGVLSVAGPAELAVEATSGGPLAVRGRLPRVGWARYATRLAVLTTGPDAAPVVLCVDIQAPGVDLVEGTNLAGEPRDSVTLDTEVSDWAPVGEEVGQLLRLRAALARALLLAGAMRRALDRSVHYAGQRVQFGRPIGRFQAVAQQLALAAGEVTSARAAALTAARIAERGLTSGAASQDALSAARFAVAVAKARASEAAGTVARIAHQVHGAIGFTREHDLRLATTRLWAWRDEDGSDARWHAEIGRRVLAEGADQLWPLLTRA